MVGDTPNDGASEAGRARGVSSLQLVLGDSFNLAIRTRANPRSIMRAVRERVHAVDAGQPVNEMRTAEDILSDEGWATEKFVANLFGLFAGLAVVLAAVGLYSVVSFAVTARYREFGIRMALGASKSSVLLDVIISGWRAVGSGLAAGLLLSMLVNGAFRHWTQGSMYDLPVMAAVSIRLLVVSGAASLWPAWRASQVAPATALRYV